MSIIFESTVTQPEYRRKDHATLNEACDHVEAAGSGSVTKFIVTDNTPGLWPLKVHRSLAHMKFEDGAWTDTPIH